MRSNNGKGMWTFVWIESIGWKNVNENACNKKRSEEGTGTKRDTMTMNKANRVGSNFIYFPLLLHHSIFVVGNNVDDDGPFRRMLHLTSMGIKSQWMTFFAWTPKQNRVYNEEVIGGQDVTQSFAQYSFRTRSWFNWKRKKYRRSYYAIIMKWRRKISQLNWRALKSERANVCALMTFHFVPVKYHQDQVQALHSLAIQLKSCTMFQTSSKLRSCSTKIIVNFRLLLPMRRKIPHDHESESKRNKWSGRKSMSFMSNS